MIIILIEFCNRTLAEPLQLVKRSETPVRLNIETKLTPDDAGAADPTTFVRLIVDVLKEAEMLDRATIQSFDSANADRGKACRSAHRDILPDDRVEEHEHDDPGRRRQVALARRLEPDGAGRIRSRARQGGGLRHLVEMFWQNLTPALVTEAHAMGIKVLPWTVNDPADMRRLIEMQVDEIITDYPDRLRRAMA